MLNVICRPAIAAILLLCEWLASCEPKTENVKKGESRIVEKSTQQSSTIILDSTNGNTIYIEQLNGDSNVVEINGKKWVNGKRVK